MAELVVARDVAASPARVWEVMTDWAAHEQWMPLTRAEGGRGVGEGVRAFTGVGRVGVVDTMTIAVWEPPARVVMRHTGSVVRGSGSFEVRPLGPDRCRVVWSEWLDLPGGRLGRLGWPAVRPLARVVGRVALARLARLLEPGR